MDNVSASWQFNSAQNDDGAKVAPEVDFQGSGLHLEWVNEDRGSKHGVASKQRLRRS